MHVARSVASAAVVRACAMHIRGTQGMERQARAGMHCTSL